LCALGSLGKLEAPGYIVNPNYLETLNISLQRIKNIMVQVCNLPVLGTGWYACFNKPQNGFHSPLLLAVIYMRLVYFNI
jgi:hypothetical protein